MVSRGGLAMTATMVMMAVLINKEICCYQPSSPTAASHYPVTQTLPLTFVAVAMAKALVAVVVVVAVAWQWRWQL